MPWHSKPCAPQQEKLRQRKAHALQLESSPCSPQLERSLHTVMKTHKHTNNMVLYTENFAEYISYIKCTYHYKHMHKYIIFLKTEEGRRKKYLPSLAWPRLPIYSIMSQINGCCLKPVSFTLLCYTALPNTSPFQFCFLKALDKCKMTVFLCFQCQYYCLL